MNLPDTELPYKEDSLYLQLKPVENSDGEKRVFHNGDRDYCFVSLITSNFFSNIYLQKTENIMSWRYRYLSFSLLSDRF